MPTSRRKNTRKSVPFPGMPQGPPIRYNLKHGVGAVALWRHGTTPRRGRRGRPPCCRGRSCKEAAKAPLRSQISDGYSTAGTAHTQNGALRIQCCSDNTASSLRRAQPRGNPFLACSETYFPRKKAPYRVPFQTVKELCFSEKKAPLCKGSWREAPEGLLKIV